MYMAQNSSRKHFWGVILERDTEDHVVYTQNLCFPGERVAIILPFWVVPDEVTQPRTICSTTSVCYYWQQWTGLASPCLLTIPDACLVVGTCQVQCVELGAEAPSIGGILQVRSRMQPQWDSAPSCIHLPCSVTPTSGAGSKIRKRKAERCLIKHTGCSILQR